MDLAAAAAGWIRQQRQDGPGSGANNKMKGLKTMENMKGRIAAVYVDLKPGDTNGALYTVEYFSNRTRYYFQDRDIIPEKVFAFIHSGLVTFRNGPLTVYRYGNQ